jgi:hypothetical protein
MIRIILILNLIYYFINTFFNTETQIKWIPFSQIIYLKEIARGNYGIIYQATWRNKKVAIKKFSNSKDFETYFLNEVCTYCTVVIIFFSKCFFIVRFYNIYY